MIRKFDPCLKSNRGNTALFNSVLTVYEIAIRVLSVRKYSKRNPQFPFMEGRIRQHTMKSLSLDGCVTYV